MALLLQLLLVVAQGTSTSAAASSSSGSRIDWSGLRLFGVTDHGAIGHFVPTSPHQHQPPGEMHQFRAAFDSARYGPGWDELEKQRGVLNFTYDTLLTLTMQV